MRITVNGRPIEIEEKNADPYALIASKQRAMLESMRRQQGRIFAILEPSPEEWAELEAKGCRRMTQDELNHLLSLEREFWANRKVNAAPPGDESAAPSAA